MSVFPLVKFWAGRKKNNSQSVEVRKLRVEALEERQMLSAMDVWNYLSANPNAESIVVTTTDDDLDDNDGISLRDAIAAINTKIEDRPASISDMPTTVTFSFTASGNANSFQNPDAWKTITLTNQLEIYSNKTITIDGKLSDSENVVINGNNACRLFNLNNSANVTLKNLTLQNGKGTNYGGAIYSKSNLTLDNVTFQNNTAVPPQNTTNNIWQIYGGAIYAINSKTATCSLSLKDVSFINNRADCSSVEESSEGRGGAIYCEVSTTFEGTCSFVGNKAGTFNNETPVNNSVKAYGGAIYGANNATITFNAGGNYTFDNNKSIASGGAIFIDGGVCKIGHKTDATNSDSPVTARFTNNKSYKYGGAISNIGGDVNIYGTCQFGTDGDSGNAAKLGGAIYNKGTLNIEGLTTNSQCSFIGNYVTSNNDGKYGSGGAIYNSSGKATISNATFTDNAAYKYGGAISNFAVGDANSPGLSLNSVICKENEAGEGGALHNSGIATVANFSARDNVAIKRDSFLVKGDKGGNGGAIYQANSDKYSTSTLTIINGSFEGNKAKNAGGAVDIVSGTVTFNGNLTLANNKAGTKTESDGGNNANYGIGGAIVAVGNILFDANPTFNFGVDATHPHGTNNADYGPNVAATANYGGTSGSRITDLKNGFFRNNQNVNSSLFTAFVQERQANNLDKLTFAYFADSVGVVKNSQGEVVNVQSVHVSTDQVTWTELTGAEGETPFSVPSPVVSGGFVDVYYYVNDYSNYIFTLSFSVTNTMNMAVQRIDSFVGLSSGVVGFTFASFGSKPISTWEICWDYTGKNGDVYVPYSKYGYSLNAFNWYEDNKSHQIGLKVLLEGETESLSFGAVAMIPARDSQGTTNALLDKTSLTSDFFADEELVDDLFVL